jgi:hypothetical protein
MLIVFAAIVVVTLMILYPEHFILLFLINMAFATPYIYLVTFRGIMQPTIWQMQPDKSKEKMEEELDEAEEIKIQKTRNVQTLIYYFLSRKELRSYRKSIHHLYLVPALFFMDVDVTILILVTKQMRSHEYETIEHMVGATKEFLGPEE